MNLEKTIVIKNLNQEQVELIFNGVFEIVKIALFEFHNIYDVNSSTSESVRNDLRTILTPLVAMFVSGIDGSLDNENNSIINRNSFLIEPENHLLN